MVSRQQAFDTAVKALIKQGRGSIDDEYTCLYRGPNGAKCAIGHLIPDDKYKPGWDVNNFGAWHTPIARAVGMPDDGMFLTDLQRCHDDAAVLKLDRFINRFKMEASQFADMYGLSKEVLNDK